MKEFVHKYSLQKTLRFELRPVGETAERIHEFKNEALVEIVKRDEQRAVDFKKMKRILDDYYRYFIDKVLDGKALTKKEIDDAYAAYCRFVADRGERQARDAFGEIQKQLRKKIAGVFTAQAKDYGLARRDFSHLICESGSGKNRTMPLLWHWLRNRYESGEQSKERLEEFEEQERALKQFNRIATYFTGYIENRDNMFTAEEQRTAIAYRIVHENMERHFENCMRFDIMKKKYRELYASLREYHAQFVASSYLTNMTQDGINAYNEVIGRKSDEQYAKGINQHINEYRQRNGITGRDMPLMSQLYKQILSDVPAGYRMDKFESDAELFLAIRELYDEFKKNAYLEALKEVVAECLCNDENLESIYVRSDTVNELSQRLFADWGALGIMLAEYAEKTIAKKKEREAWLKSDAYSMQNLQAAVDERFRGQGPGAGNTVAVSIRDYFLAMSDGNVGLRERCETAYEDVKNFLDGERIDTDRRMPSDATDSGGEGFRQIEKIKAFLDSIMAIIHFYKPLYLFKQGKMIEVDGRNISFYDSFNQLYDAISIAIGVYNKARNYLTKKPYSMEKFKINFNSGQLLSGWDVNKESDHLGVLLFKGGKYYLGIMDKKHNKIFKHANDTKTASEVVKELGGEYYEKIVYKQIPSPAANLPRIIVSNKGSKLFNPPPDIIRIENEKLYVKSANDRASMHRWIDFCKKSIEKHPEWNRYFHFSFTPTKQYSDVSQFYKEVAEQGYSLSFDRIKASYIEEKVAAGELYLFEIYNKDFSAHSKGQPNLHTSYWRLLFAKENLDNLVLKLNGEAEIFFRPASLEATTVHKANRAIENKNPENEKRSSEFPYDIVKDRRFTRDKFFFHCPITLNFRATGAFRFNQEVCEYLENGYDGNIIGLDRGERHLLYYVVINKRGAIIEQGDLNRISSDYAVEGNVVRKMTDYHGLLATKEKERDAARKAWSAVENIKELKSGYLSHVVHKLAALMVRHNAIVVLEDLNFGFKRGRFKIEKQVYQKFEKALIDKLNYLVFKNTPVGFAGHYLSAYQLAAPFESFDKLYRAKQSGFLFYVPASYTSKIDPMTGFVDFLRPRYESVEKSRAFFGKFTSIRYNPAGDYFEFDFDYKDFTDRAEGRTRWTACTHGRERYWYSRETKSYEARNVTSEIGQLLDNHKIDWRGGAELREHITKNVDTGFHKTLTFLFSLTLQLRHTYKNHDGAGDFILSPVADADGKFFDSRTAGPELPENADANGAYHIALKGLFLLRGIRDGRAPVIANRDWFAFAQGLRARH